MRPRTAEDLLDQMRGFQVPCVLAAAAELDVFQAVSAGPGTAQEIAARLTCDTRSLTILLDALAGIGVLDKAGPHYALPKELAPFLSESSPHSVLAMLRHQGNCLRKWARLAWVVQAGQQVDAGPSVRGAAADGEAFIEAMHVVSLLVADPLVREVHPGGFHRLLDIGGASGTWSASWLRAEPTAKAILFDLPAVLPMARQRMENLGLLDRVDFVAGDYNQDDLPPGADLVWLSAIIHQNSRAENRALFQRIAKAMQAGGRLLIRDVMMEDSRTEPPAGALFAVNMLVATQAGSTYTFGEISEDLASADFTGIRIVRHDPGMHSIVSARR